MMSQSPYHQKEEKPTEDKQEPYLLYGIEDRPPWYLFLLLSLQQLLLSATGSIAGPFIIAIPLCLADDDVGMGEFLSTVFFMVGVASLLQTAVGVRLPIIQGPSASFILPIVTLMNTKSTKCPNFHNPGNLTLPFEAGSEEHRTFWKSNLAEVQGALMVASVLEVVLGFSGMIGVLKNYIGPLTTGTVLTLIGLSLSNVASQKGSTHWWLCFVTIFLVVLFSQYLRKVSVPFVGGTRLKIFLLFPVLLAMCITWLICLILTETDLLPDKRGEWGYEARTDIKTDAIHNAEWFRFPYPGQWGTPTLNAGAVVAMMAALLASAIESIGDYHACARFCSVPPPPGSAISRGIGMEGIGCLLCGAWGTGAGVTSYSANIAVIGLTKVASRGVIVLTAVMLIVAGCVGKVGALFSSVPDPIIGAIIYVTFGMITAIGISNLQLVDLNSTRNLFVFGFSVFFGLSVPGWVAKNQIDVGDDTANEALTVICSTSMLVGGIISFVLDNTIAGTLKERGIVTAGDNENDNDTADLSTYNLPWIQPFLDRVKCLRLLCRVDIKFGDLIYLAWITQIAYNAFSLVQDTKTSLPLGDLGTSAKQFYFDYKNRETKQVVPQLKSIFDLSDILYVPFCPSFLKDGYKPAKDPTNSNMMSLDEIEIKVDNSSDGVDNTGFTPDTPTQ